jgi:hypothetical protein
MMAFPIGQPSFQQAGSRRAVDEGCRGIAGRTVQALSDVRDGDFNDLTGAALVMITAGVNEKTGGAIDRSDAASNPRP